MPQVVKDAPSILAPMITHLNEENAKLKARVAEIECEIEVSYESRASASAIVAGNEEISRAIEARDEERLRVAEARVVELVEDVRIFKHNEDAITGHLKAERARVAELETQVKERFNAFKTEQARVAELEAKSVRHAEEIDEWKEASGIVTGSGDPADVTPRMAASYWNDIDRDLTKSQLHVDELEAELRMAKVGDEVGHRLLDISIDDGAEKVTEIISLRARVVVLEKCTAVAFAFKERMSSAEARVVELEADVRRLTDQLVCYVSITKPDQSGEGSDA